MVEIKRHSKKRDAILNYLKSTTAHPTAETIYSELKSEIPDLSLATVYRNLNQFIKEGAIISVGVHGGQEHFDADTRQHTHFICDECGSISDLDTEFDSGLDALAEEKFGCTITGHSLVFTGMCRHCTQREP